MTTLISPHYARGKAPRAYARLVCVLFIAQCVALSSACLDKPHQVCAETGRTCPPGFVCAPGGVACVADNSCGNGVVDPDELCDDGNRLSGDGCSSDCQSQEVCGNGIRDIFEACDDSNLQDDDGCSATCLIEGCGNDEVQGQYEVCDDGSHENGDGCSADCASQEACGNGYIDWALGERCDDGNTDDGDECPADCSAGNCGDGVLQQGEACDDNNRDDGDGCSAVCLIESMCGNGSIEAGEQCDTRGIQNATCDDDCTFAVCGDGAINEAAGEQCDDEGISERCDADCTAARCGDGTLNPAAGEVCDDGNANDRDTCTTLCAPPDCNDGIVSGDETDVDCGGACTDKCMPNQACVVDSDCFTGMCNSGVCHGSTLAPGANHTCAILDTGAVRCWGLGNLGQLGYGNTESIGDDEEPRSAGTVELGGPVRQIAAGVDFTCALLDTGDVRCWGANDYGQLGYGNMDNIGDDEVPTSAGPVNIGGPVRQLAVGAWHVCAVLNTDDVRCWGRGDSGQLGYGNVNNIGDDEEPGMIGAVDVGGAVQQIAAGSGHTCALLGSGQVRCWGSGGGGQLGYGNMDNIGDDELPGSVGTVNVGGAVRQLAADGGHTCALLEAGTVRCWGVNNFGQLGYGDTFNIGDDEEPGSLAAVEVGGVVQQIVTGSGHTCALLGTGAVRCWGDGQFGQLGYGNINNIGDGELPNAAGPVSVGGAVQQLARGGNYICALLDAGAMRCWGIGSSGQLGYGNTNNIGDDELPSSVGDVPYR